MTAEKGGGEEGLVAETNKWEDEDFCAALEM